MKPYGYCPSDAKRRIDPREGTPKAGDPQGRGPPREVLEDSMKHLLYGNKRSIVYQGVSKLNT